VRCIILHVSIYINQPEVGNNLTVIKFLKIFSSAHTVDLCVSYVHSLFTYPTLTYEFPQTRGKVCTLPWRKNPIGPGPPHYRGYMTTLRHTTAGRTPLDEGSAHRRDIYLANAQHSKQTDIHATDGIRNHNPSNRAAAHLRLRPRGHLSRKGVYSAVRYKTLYIHPVNRTLNA